MCSKNNFFLSKNKILALLDKLSVVEFTKYCVFYSILIFGHRFCFLGLRDIEEGILEAKTECYSKDKVKSPLFFRSFYDDF